MGLKNIRSIRDWLILPCAVLLWTNKVFREHSWQCHDTNGDGVILIREFNGQKLMTLAQTLDVHLQIQEYMRGLTRLHGARKFRRSLAPFTGSRIVSPAESDSSRYGTSYRQSGYSFSGGVF